MKKCTKCFETKEKSQFGKDNQKKDKLSSYCKECIKKRSRSQRENNIEYYEKYAKDYRESNKESLREKNFTDYYLRWDIRREQAKRSYEKHKENIAKKRAERSRLSEVREYNRLRQKKWRSENRSLVGKFVSDWKKRNPEKSGAHSLVLWALKTGFIKKPLECQECKEEKKLEAHHCDYSKPLKVIWLCKGCHSKKHRKYR